MWNEKLRNFRESKKYSQAEFAELLGMKQPAYQKMEKEGAKYLQIHLMKRLFELGFDLNELIVDKKIDEDKKLFELEIRLDERTNERNYWRENITTTLQRCADALGPNNKTTVAHGAREALRT